MKWKLLLGVFVFVFLLKTSIFCTDGFISPAILNQAIFSAIKKPGNLSINQRKHASNLLKILCPELKTPQIKNSSANIYLQSLAKKLSIKTNFFQLLVLKKLILILAQDLRQIPCTGQNCHICQASSIFIIENGPQIKALANSLEKNSRWFRWFKIKKKHIFSMAILSTPPLTWIFRRPLSKIVIEPLSKFIEWNLPWFLPFLASCLSFFSFYKFNWRPGLKKNDNIPPPEDQNPDKEKEKERTNLIPPIESELDSTADLLEQASAHLAALSSELDLSVDNLRLKIEATQLQICKIKLEEKRLKEEAKKTREESLSEEESSEHKNKTRPRKQRRGAMTSSSLTGFPQRTAEVSSTSSSSGSTISSSGLGW